MADYVYGILKLHGNMKYILGNLINALCVCEYACNFYLMEMGKYPYLKIQYKSMETYTLIKIEFCTV